MDRDGLRRCSTWRVGSVTCVADATARQGAIARLREMYADEVNGGALFRGLAEYAEPQRRDVFLTLAAAEERHAAHWAELLREAGVEPRTPAHAVPRARCASSPASSAPKRCCR